MSETDTVLILDLKGLKCPLPVLKTRKALAGLAAGVEIEVIATDPMSAIDIPHMCHEDGHRLVAMTRPDDRRIVFRIERGASAKTP